MVVSPLAMLKLFQFIMARGLLWLMLRIFPPGVIVAAPRATTPPTGLANAWEQKNSGKRGNRKPWGHRIIVFIIKARADIWAAARFKTMPASRQGFSIFGKYGCLETVETPVPWPASNSGSMLEAQARV